MSTARPVTTAACAALEMTGGGATQHAVSLSPCASPLVLISVSLVLRSDTIVHRGAEERSFHGSLPHLDHPLSTHSSLHQIDSHSRHSSQRDISEAPSTLITHGTTANDSRVAENDGTSA